MQAVLMHQCWVKRGLLMFQSLLICPQKFPLSFWVSQHFPNLGLGLSCLLERRGGEPQTGQQ